MALATCRDMGTVRDGKDTGCNFKLLCREGGDNLW